MTKRFHLLLSLSAIIVFSSEVRAADLWGKINPPGEAQNASMYTLPGFDFKTCKIFEECRAVAWPPKDAMVLVRGAIDIQYKKSEPPVRYYRVEYVGDSGLKTGYLEKKYVTVSREPDPMLCETHPFSIYVASAEDVVSLTLETVLKNGIPAMNNRRDFSPKCERFIDDKGKLGVWGQGVLSAMDKVDTEYKAKTGKSCFYDTMDMSDVCPNFKDFGPNLKKSFWAYAFASLAADESSCRTEAQARGPNGTADGLFQLEYSQALRRRSGRDGDSCSTRRGVNTQSTDFQFNCAASIFLDLHCDSSDACESKDSKREQSCIARRRKINWSGGYWERLRGSSGDVINMIKKFPSCFEAGK